MFTRSFWTATLERAVKTAAQAAIAIVAAVGFSWFSADWQAIASTVATATALSVLSSIASEGIGPKGTPGIVAD